MGMDLMVLMRGRVRRELGSVRVTERSVSERECVRVCSMGMDLMVFERAC